MQLGFKLLKKWLKSLKSTCNFVFGSIYLSSFMANLFFLGITNIFLENDTRIHKIFGAWWSYHLLGNFVIFCFDFLGGPGGEKFKNDFSTALALILYIQKGTVIYHDSDTFSTLRQFPQKLCEPSILFLFA